jgi:hypothetical protein
LEKQKEIAALALVESQDDTGSNIEVRAKPVDGEDDFFNPDDENSIVETYEMKIANRTAEILKDVFIEYDTRMFTKSTSRALFYETNREKARALAIKEYEEEMESKSMENVSHVLHRIAK